MEPKRGKMETNSCDTKYLVQLRASFSGNIESEHKAVDEELKAIRYEGVLKVNKLSSTQIEVTGVGEPEVVSEHLKALRSNLEQYNKVIKGATGYNAVEMCCLYKEAYDTCDGCD